MELARGKDGQTIFPKRLNDTYDKVIVLGDGSTIEQWLNYTRDMSVSIPVNVSSYALALSACQNGHHVTFFDPVRVSRARGDPTRSPCMVSTFSGSLFLDVDRQAWHLPYALLHTENYLSLSAGMPMVSIVLEPECAVVDICGWEHEGLLLDDRGRVWKVDWGTCRSRSKVDYAAQATLFESLHQATQGCPIIRIYPNDAHYSFAMDERRRLFGFGYAPMGQLGIPYDRSSAQNLQVVEMRLPFAVPLQISPTRTHVIMLDHQGGLWSMGENGSGQLGTEIRLGQESVLQNGSVEPNILYLRNGPARPNILYSHALRPIKYGIANPYLGLWRKHLDPDSGQMKCVQQKKPTFVRLGICSDECKSTHKDSSAFLQELSEFVQCSASGGYSFAQDKYGCVWKWGNPDGISLDGGACASVTIGGEVVDTRYIPRQLDLRFPVPTRFRQVLKSSSNVAAPIPTIPTVPTTATAVATSITTTTNDAHKSTDQEIALEEAKSAETENDPVTTGVRSPSCLGKRTYVSALSDHIAATDNRCDVDSVLHNADTGPPREQE